MPLACWPQSCERAFAMLRGLPHACSPVLPLDGLLSLATLRCKLEFAVRSAARGHLGLPKCGL